MTDGDQQADILQRDWIRFVEEQLGVEQWVPVYRYVQSELETVVLFSAFLPNALVPTAASNESWELRIGDGRPGCTVSGMGSKRETVSYHRVPDDGVEPVVLRREFAGIRPRYSEVLEEFRLLHNLYFDAQSNRYLRFDDAGEEEEVVRITDTEVSIRLRELKQFCAIRDMHLALYFSIDRRSPSTPEELGLPQIIQAHRRDLIAYKLFASPTTFSKKHATITRLEGKKIIPPMPKEQCGIWPYEVDEIHEQFIIGADSNGTPILHTCNPDALADYFGKNPNAPHYLSKRCADPTRVLLLTSTAELGWAVRAPSEEP